MASSEFLAVVIDEFMLFNYTIKVSFSKNQCGVILSRKVAVALFPTMLATEP